MSKRYLYNINGELKDNSIEKFANLEDYYKAKKEQDDRKKEVEAIKRENKEKSKKLKEDYEKIKKDLENNNCYMKHKFPRGSCGKKCLLSYQKTIRKCQSKIDKRTELEDYLKSKIDEIYDSNKDRFWKLSKISEARKYIESIEDKYTVSYNDTYNTWKRKWSTSNTELDTTELKNNYDNILVDLQMLYSKPVDCKYKYDKCDSKCNSKLIIEINPDKDGKKCPRENSIKCPEGVGDCPHTPINCNEIYSKCKILNDNEVPNEFKGRCGKKNIIYEKSKHNGKPCKNSPYKLCMDGQGSCPKDCVGKWSKCNKFCKSNWITTKKEINGGKCIFKNKTKNCNPGEGECEENIDCEGTWSKCINKNNKCVKIWNVTRKQKGLGNKCRYIDQMEVSCDDCEIIPKIPDIKRPPVEIPEVPEEVPVKIPEVNRPPVEVPEVPEEVPVKIPEVSEEVPVVKQPDPIETSSSDESNDKNTILYLIIGILLLLLLVSNLK